MRAGRLLVLGLLLASLGASCRMAELRRNLSPPYADFLSKVRYIITSQEERTFLGLPDAEKDGFIEEFWKRRDPDPGTEESEFKTEYFARLERANRLFGGEGKAGWLTDRGRIFILFGPPLDRIIDPTGSQSLGVCTEVWYYGSFPVVFRDVNCMGHYELVTYDLTSLRDVNLQYMQELSLAQARMQQTYPLEKQLFDFEVRVSTETAAPEKIEGRVELSIPYSSVWFRIEAGTLKTEFEVQLELVDPTGAVRWEHKDRLELGLAEAEFKEKQGESYTAEIPFRIADPPAELRGGQNTLRVRVKNTTGNEQLRKSVVVVF